MVEVDGSMMEGGGQILRMAVTYGVLMGVPVRVRNIRARRKPPGLRPQHLETLIAVAEMSGAETKGLRLGSMEIELAPGKPEGGSYSFDIGTAGSIALMLQCLAPIAAFSGSPSRLEIRGGTNVRWSPPTSFLDRVIWGAFREMGFGGTISVHREGFYPRGGGSVTVEIQPVTTLRPLRADEQSFTGVGGISICGRLPSHVAERQASSAAAQLEDAGLESKINVRTDSGRRAPFSPGSVICLWVDSDPPVYIGSSALGERGKPAENVGGEAARNLVDELSSGAAVDRYTADNLILWSSLASGESSYTASEVTLHTRTAIELARTFTGADVRVEPLKGGSARIRVNGIGLENGLLS